MVEQEFLAAGQKRRAWLAPACALAVLGCVLGATILAPPSPRLVWNVSASVPRGPYLVGSRDDILVGEMVIARTPEPWRHLAAVRGYLPVNVPLVKRAAAGPDDIVCASDRRVLVNGRLVAERRPVDGAGRTMPWWTGCVRLGAGALFLLTDDPASFDGRYFGPTERGNIIGRARLLWPV